MKKIININLSGRAIPIEDGAFEILKKYIESLRKHFANEEGAEEIINDIESRIAEIMNDTIRKGAHCITETDVDAIINTMGRPQDFEQPENASTTSDTSKAGTNSFIANLPKGRYYRNEADKIIAGVCGGLGNYFNLDTSIIRIIFILLTIFGYGIGLIIYAILWIFTPLKVLESTIGKRLFRNPDDRVLGGVAGGLSLYFNTNAWLFRLIFLLPILISLLLNIVFGHHFGIALFVFGSISFTFLIVYVVLWLLVPEAKSNYDKMEMHGQNINIDTISKSVKENTSNYEKAYVENVAPKIKEGVRKAGSGIESFFRIIFKLIFIVIGLIIVVSLFAGLIALLSGGVIWWPFSNFIWTSNYQMMLTWGTLIFFVLSPIVGFLIWGIRRLLKISSKKHYLAWLFTGFWILGWVMAILLAISVSSDFKHYEHHDTIIPITQPQNNRLVLAVPEPRLHNSGQFGWVDNDNNGWSLTNDTFKISNIQIAIVKSETNEFKVTLKKYSFGESYQNSVSRASKTDFTVKNEGSFLLLDNGQAISKHEKFRGQNIVLEIEVPVGKEIMLDASLREKLGTSSVQLKQGYSNYKNIWLDWNEEEMHDENETNTLNYGLVYEMKATGWPELKWINNKRITDAVDQSAEVQRMQNSIKDSIKKIENRIRLMNEIEAEKIRRQKSEDKIKELEEKYNPISKISKAVDTVSKSDTHFLETKLHGLILV